MTESSDAISTDGRPPGAVSDFLSLLSGSATVHVVNLVYLALAARLLGPADFGAYALIMAVASILTVCVGFGRVPVIVRETAVGQGDGRHHVIQAGLLQQMGMAFVAAAVFVLIGAVVPQFSPHRDSVVLAALALLFAAPSAVLDAHFKGSKRMGTCAVWQVLHVAIKAAVGLVLLVRGFSVSAMLWALFASDFGSLTYLLWAYHRHTGRWPVPARRPIGRTLLRDGRHVFFGRMTGMLFSRFDWLYLGSLRTTAVLGSYSVAYRIFEILIQIPGLFALSMFPRLCETEDASGSNRTPRPLVFKLAMGPGCVFGVFLLLWAGPVILTVLGPAYESALLPLQILGASLAFHGGCGILYHLAIARRRERFLLRSSAVAAGLNIVLCLALIPAHGAVGAAVAMVIPSVVQFFLLCFVANERRMLLAAPVYVARVAVLVGVVAIAAAQLPVHWGIQMAAALLVLAPVLWVFGGFSPEERTTLSSVVRRTFSRRRAGMAA